MKDVHMRTILFETWDKQAANGELQKNPEVLTKIYMGMSYFLAEFRFLQAGRRPKSPMQACSGSSFIQNLDCRLQSIEQNSKGKTFQQM